MKSHLNNAVAGSQRHSQINAFFSLIVGLVLGYALCALTGPLSTLFSTIPNTDQSVPFVTGVPAVVIPDYIKYNFANYTTIPLGPHGRPAWIKVIDNISIPTPTASMNLSMGWIPDIQSLEWRLVSWHAQDGHAVVQSSDAKSYNIMITELLTRDKSYSIWINPVGKTEQRVFLRVDALVVPIKTEPLTRRALSDPCTLTSENLTVSCAVEFSVPAGVHQVFAGIETLVKPPTARPRLLAEIVMKQYLAPPCVIANATIDYNGIIWESQYDVPFSAIIQGVERPAYPIPIPESDSIEGEIRFTMLDPGSDGRVKINGWFSHSSIRLQ